MLPSIPELVIFDCDGVLVDTELPANRILQEGLAELGLSLSLPETMARFTGRSFPDIRRALSAELPKAAPEGFWAGLQAKTFAAFDAGLLPVAGAAELLQTLAGQLCLPFCVASSGSHRKIRHALGAAGLLQWFDDARIFSAEDVLRGKPAPDLFLHAAGALGALPSSCLVIEDSLPGMRAGLAAGIPTLLLKSCQAVRPLPGALQVDSLQAVQLLLQNQAAGLHPGEAGQE